jgi:hypothetical protein
MSVTGAAYRTGTVQVNGADIHHEVRGSGPAILFVAA